MAVVNILLNGESRQIPKNTHLGQLLELLSLQNQLVAIELNGSVIRRVEWAETELSETDKIEVVHFVGRG